MGTQLVSTSTSHKERTDFIHRLLDDVQALEIMLDKGMFEKGVHRIGAEQEFCLVTDNWRPSVVSNEVYKAVNDPHFTTELARYNLEINMDPLLLEGTCFSDMHKELSGYLDKADEAALANEARVILTGILPTITRKELEFEFMTPNPRYRALNNMMREVRGDDFQLHIKGVDELSVLHDNVLFEACNTSFQLHLQISPKDFIPSYNWSQAISGPVLGICTNSPLLMGRELWAETRIALFRQSLDTHKTSFALKEQEPRVTFGSGWAEKSVVDVFKDGIARHKVLVVSDVEENSMQALFDGRIPKLKALQLHNGTVYRWNRPCYGISDNGKPHLRIENRYIPAGPSVTDEMANFVFWVGLMAGRPARFDNMSAEMDFEDAKNNFLKAARSGKESGLVWNGDLKTVKDIIEQDFLPMAESGLKRMKVNDRDIERYLSVIAERCVSRTGSQWMVTNMRKLTKEIKKDQALVALTSAIYENQKNDIPVHKWEDVENADDFLGTPTTVGQIMISEPFTVHENDVADMAASIMQWKNIHHVPVEGKTGKLTGILTWTHMKKQLHGSEHSNLVGEIMTKDLITVDRETPISEAVKLMKKHEIGCLPIVKENELEGIITVADLIPFVHANGV